MLFPALKKRVVPLLFLSGLLLHWKEHGSVSLGFILLLSTCVYHYSPPFTSLLCSVLIEMGLIFALLNWLGCLWGLIIENLQSAFLNVSAKLYDYFILPCTQEVGQAFLMWLQAHGHVTWQSVLASLLHPEQKEILSLMAGAIFLFLCEGRDGLFAGLSEDRHSCMIAVFAHLSET